MLSRQYMGDLWDNLLKQIGLCITDDIIVHLMWADDLVLVSHSEIGLQKLLNDIWYIPKQSKQLV